MDISKYIRDFQERGYVNIQNFFKLEDIEKVKQIIYQKGFDENKSEIYYEFINNKKKIRRVENLSSNYEEFNNLIFNNLLLEILYEIFNEKVFLFKEKLNFKPSSGGGKFRMHIDGHFDWYDSNNIKKKGWEEYGNNFVNAVIPIESSNMKNGCLYVCDKSETYKLYGKSWDNIKSKLDGSGPYLKYEDESLVKKIYIEQEPTDLLLFDWQCIHGSEKNLSKFERPILYLTYNSFSDGNNLEQYYFDKKHSKNSKKQKSLY